MEIQALFLCHQWTLSMLRSRGRDFKKKKNTYQKSPLSDNSVNFSLKEEKMDFYRKIFWHIDSLNVYWGGNRIMHSNEIKVKRLRMQMERNFRQCLSSLSLSLCKHGNNTCRMKNSCSSQDSRGKKGQFIAQSISSSQVSFSSYSTSSQQKLSHVTWHE